MKKFILLTAIVFYAFQFCYSQAGQLDSSFGTNGIVTTNFESLPGLSQFRSTAVQTDGKLVAGGITTVGSKSYLILARYDTNGSLDKTFSEDGKVLADSFTTGSYPSVSLALQKDQKIVVAGSALFRFNTDGTLDISFANSGKQTISFGSANDQAQSLAIQSDGKIVVGGTSVNQVNNSKDFGLARYNTNGSPDNTFSEDGMLTTDVSVFEFYGDTLVSDNNTLSVAVQSDGKILLAGNNEGKRLEGDSLDPFYTYFYSYSILRYNTKGSLDSSFAGDGIVTSETTNGDNGITAMHALALQADDKIIVTQTIVDNPSIKRFNKDGTVDNKFGPYGGYVYLDFSYSHFTNHEDIPISIQSDGKIVAGSTQVIYDTSSYFIGFKLVRFNINGSTDSSFSEDGIQTTDLSSSWDFIYSLAISNNKIYASGSASDTAALVSYTQDGELNSFYGNGGIVKTNFVYERGETHYNSTAVQTDGKIVAVGSSFNGTITNFAIARYNPDGSLDNTFSEDGKQTTNFGVGQSATANSVAIQQDGKIIAVGTISGNYPIPARFAIARFNTDGTPDNTFSGDGKDTTGFDVGPTGYISANSVAIQNDNKIVVAGSYGIVRYNTDGSLDKTFSGDGKQTNDFSQDLFQINSTVIQKDGKILVAGNRGWDLAVQRYNTDGSLDKSFFSNERGTGYPFQLIAFNIVLQPNGKILAAGDSYWERFAVARLNMNGSPDSSFSEDGIQIAAYNQQQIGHAKAVTIQNDGKILAAGDALSGSGTAFALSRYNNDGTFDSSFGENGLQITKISTGNDGIASIAISDTKLYAVGTSGEGGNSGTIARYLLNNSSNIFPSVSLTSPANNATYIAPAAHVKLSAAASDSDGTITKVEFYNGNKLLHTETVIPYGFVWRNVPLGNYTITAKAYDNSGNVTTSAPVHISVIPNKPPVVSIVKPANNQSFAAPAYIHFEAAASDSDGRITRVKFYNDSTLLRIEYKYPYTYVWKNVPVGVYKITAVATDNYGAQTTSVPIKVRVKPAGAIVSNKPYLETEKTASNDAFRLRLSPNPANNILNIYTNVLQENKAATLSIISLSGNVLKTINISNAATQLDVSMLAGGVYTVKIVSGDKVTYKQFVKL